MFPLLWGQQVSGKSADVPNVDSVDNFIEYGGEARNMGVILGWKNHLNDRLYKTDHSSILNVGNSLRTHY